MAEHSSLEFTEFTEATRITGGLSKHLTGTLAVNDANSKHAKRNAPVARNSFD